MTATVDNLPVRADIANLVGSAKTLKLFDKDDKSGRSARQTARVIAAMVPTETAEGVLGGQDADLTGSTDHPSGPAIVPDDPNVHHYGVA